MGVLDYSAIIHGALQGLEGEKFSRMELQETELGLLVKHIVRLVTLQR